MEVVSFFLKKGKCLRWTNLTETKSSIPLYCINLFQAIFLADNWTAICTDHSAVFTSFYQRIGAKNPKVTSKGRAIFLFTVREHLMVSITWSTQNQYLRNWGEYWQQPEIHSMTTARLSAMRRLFEAIHIAQTHRSNLLSNPAKK